MPQNGYGLLLVLKSLSSLIHDYWPTASPAVVHSLPDRRKKAADFSTAFKMPRAFMKWSTGELFASFDESGSGTKLTCSEVLGISAFKGEADAVMVDASRKLIYQYVPYPSICVSPQIEIACPEIVLPRGLHMNRIWSAICSGVT
jgi:hypothetical protein